MSEFYFKLKSFDGGVLGQQSTFGCGIMRWHYTLNVCDKTTFFSAKLCLTFVVTKKLVELLSSCVTAVMSNIVAFMNNNIE